jgi:RNA polymerase sigma factor (sigma-70 family)
MTAPQTYEQMSDPAGEMTDELLLEQLPQVKYIARRIHERLPQHVPFDDLVHAGIVGLIDAVHKFNPDKKVRFASYAKFRIRGAILDSLRDMDWSPRDLRRKARRLETATQKLQTELGRSATEPELALAMGMTLEEFQHLLDEIRGLEVGSLQIVSLEDGRETDLGENVLAGRAPADAGGCNCAVAQARAASARSLLPGRAHHERSGSGAGSGRIARLADPFHGSGAVAGRPGECGANSYRRPHRVRSRRCLAPGGMEKLLKAGIEG